MDPMTSMAGSTVVRHNVVVADQGSDKQESHDRENRAPIAMSLTTWFSLSANKQLKFKVNTTINYVSYGHHSHHIQLEKPM